MDFSINILNNLLRHSNDILKNCHEIVFTLTDQISDMITLNVIQIVSIFMTLYMGIRGFKALNQSSFIMIFYILSADFKKYYDKLQNYDENSIITFPFITLQQVLKLKKYIKDNETAAFIVLLIISLIMTVLLSLSIKILSTALPMIISVDLLDEEPVMELKNYLGVKGNFFEVMFFIGIFLVLFFIFWVVTRVLTSVLFAGFASVWTLLNFDQRFLNGAFVKQLEENTFIGVRKDAGIWYVGSLFILMIILQFSLPPHRK